MAIGSPKLTSSTSSLNTQLQQQAIAEASQPISQTITITNPTTSQLAGDASRYENNPGYDKTTNPDGSVTYSAKPVTYTFRQQGNNPPQMRSYVPREFTYDAQGNLIGGAIRETYQSGRDTTGVYTKYGYSTSGSNLIETVNETVSSGSAEKIKKLETNTITPGGQSYQTEVFTNLTDTQKLNRGLAQEVQVDVIRDGKVVTETRIQEGRIVDVTDEQGNLFFEGKKIGSRISFEQTPEEIQRQTAQEELGLITGIQRGETSTTFTGLSGGFISLSNKSPLMEDKILTAPVAQPKKPIVELSAGASLANAEDIARLETFQQGIQYEEGGLIYRSGQSPKFGALLASTIAGLKQKVTEPTEVSFGIGEQRAGTVTRTVTPFVYTPEFGATASLIQGLTKTKTPFDITEGNLRTADLTVRVGQENVVLPLQPGRFQQVIQKKSFYIPTDPRDREVFRITEEKTEDKFRVLAFTQDNIILRASEEAILDIERAKGITPQKEFLFTNKFPILRKAEEKLVRPFKEKVIDPAIETSKENIGKAFTFVSTPIAKGYDIIKDTPIVSSSIKVTKRIASVFNPNTITTKILPEASRAFQSFRGTVRKAELYFESKKDINKSNFGSIRNYNINTIQTPLKNIRYFSAAAEGGYEIIREPRDTLLLFSAGAVVGAASAGLVTAKGVAGKTTLNILKVADKPLKGLFVVGAGASTLAAPAGRRIQTATKLGLQFGAFVGGAKVGSTNVSGGTIPKEFRNLAKALEKGKVTAVVRADATQARIKYFELKTTGKTTYIQQPTLQNTPLIKSNIIINRGGGNFLRVSSEYVKGLVKVGPTIQSKVVVGIKGAIDVPTKLSFFTGGKTRFNIIAAQSNGSLGGRIVGKKTKLLFESIKGSKDLSLTIKNIKSGKVLFKTQVPVNKKIINIPQTFGKSYPGDLPQNQSIRDIKKGFEFLAKGVSISKGKIYGFEKGRDVVKTLTIRTTTDAFQQSVLSSALRKGSKSITKGEFLQITVKPDGSKLITTKGGKLVATRGKANLEPSTRLSSKGIIGGSKSSISKQFPEFSQIRVDTTTTTSVFKFARGGLRPIKAFKINLLDRAIKIENKITSGFTNLKTNITTRLEQRPLIVTKGGAYKGSFLGKRGGRAGRFNIPSDIGEPGSIPGTQLIPADKVVLKVAVAPGTIAPLKSGLQASIGLLNIPGSLPSLGVLTLAPPSALSLAESSGISEELVAVQSSAFADTGVQFEARSLTDATSFADVAVPVEGAVATPTEQAISQPIGLTTPGVTPQPIPEVITEPVPGTDFGGGTDTRFDFKPIEVPIIEEPVIPFFRFTSPGRKTNQGYDVQVKEKGSFNKVNTKPLPFNKARNLGAKVVDETPSASFKVVKTKKKTLIKDEKSFELMDRFRPSKVSPDVLVEKRKYRIDTPGEVQGISVKGYLAKLRRAKRWKPFI